MERKERLCKAIKKIGWGYITLYFSINIGTIDILPSWWGYLMLFREGIQEGIAEEEESVNLLKPIGLLLGIYYLITWFLTIFNIPTDVLIVDEIISVLDLYYHFQLLTNLAGIAKKYGCPQEKVLLKLRTAQTILLTILAFTIHFENLLEVSIILMIVQMILMICICLNLRNFKHALEDLPDEVFWKEDTLGISND